jgi:hypothetical protein
MLTKVQFIKQVHNKIQIQIDKNVERVQDKHQKSDSKLKFDL